MEETTLVTATSCCMECFHFKTMMLTIENIKKTRFNGDYNINIVLDSMGEVRVWFCGQKLLNNDIYYVEYLAKRLKKDGCQKADF